MPFYTELQFHFKRTIAMSEDPAEILSDSETLMKKAIDHLEIELTRIRAGKANPTMLDGIVVDYYGNPTPINQVGNLSVMDARTLTIQPWEKNMLQPIERAIIAANIGVNPQNDGNIIRLFLPVLTEERRRELVKRSNVEGENAKIAIRNIRRDAIDQTKKLQKDSIISEDQGKDAETEMQEITDVHISLVDKHLASKEKEIMVV
ncbi:ribosome recycling factor [soil metagenome]